ncbi:MAG: hypothetical protein JWS10_916 [Cypionkella sp.]|uniref:hypothetical protein n=1 Tax=Cypionkella sp. TaxID=2811411 RepID=UPI00260AE216|nr:hypothetical protein [Cypionkella sp.]MDB5658301.1 hypothetical protein [Cypionkella sp.]
MVDDTDIVLRMVWHPCHFDGDKLKTSAFEPGDLVPDNDDTGQPRYVSTDRLAGVQQGSVDWRINQQQRDGRDVRLERLKPRFVEFLCGDIRSLADEAGQYLFFVKHLPVAAGEEGKDSPENPAHCGILSTSAAPDSKKEKREKVEALRTKLLQIKRGTLSYESMFLSALAS